MQSNARGDQVNTPAWAFFKALRDLGLDISWYRYLWTVFASPAGLNLRNEIAHGFLSRPGATAAALSIHASCFLNTIQVTREIEYPT